MRRAVLALVVLLMAGQASAQADVRDPVEVAAVRSGLPVDLIRAVIAAESGGRARAVSTAGAMGLMQLMPGTWAQLRERLSLGDDPFDPADNVLAGATYLRDLHDRYGVPGFLAAYNAGPGRYEASLAGRPLPLETRLYVDRVLARTEGIGARLSDWRAAGLFPAAWSEGLGPVAKREAGGEGPTPFVLRRADGRRAVGR